ncbi:MAG: response regulator [Desulfuromonadaceae bacterium]|nr:response regulator [Desulfuromonadaceae bacterium]
MGIKLLLADDSITIQKVIGIIFGGEDYSLTVVDNGKSAVEKANELNPDVLLIDALMPGMSGYEVCEAVRAIPALAAKPILILTGSFEPFDEEKAKECGADDFLAKPFESQQIVNKVKELAELGASRAAKGVAAQPDTFSEAAAPFDDPLETIAAAISTAPAEPLQSTEPSDIWGAFTTEAEPSLTADLLQEQESADSESSDSFAPDVFAIVSEESDSQLIQTASAPSSPPQHTGTQWIPVEEHTFEFEEENAPDLPQTDFSEQTVPVLDSGFGEISFEDELPAQKSADSTTDFAPAFSDLIVQDTEIAPLEEPAPYLEPANAAFEMPDPVFATPSPDFAEPAATQVAVPTPAVTPLGELSEDQLKAAIVAASKEVIERIVWEVVPDLAESMIREAIRKIKEGA